MAVRAYAEIIFTTVFLQKDICIVKHLYIENTICFSSMNQRKWFTKYQQGAKLKEQENKFYPLATTNNKEIPEIYASKDAKQNYSCQLDWTKKKKEKKKEKSRMLYRYFFFFFVE